MRIGSPLDRNTELLLNAPFDLSTITDAQVEADQAKSRARDCQLSIKGNQSERPASNRGSSSRCWSGSRNCWLLSGGFAQAGIRCSPSTLQIAVGTVLVNNKVPILVAPNCVEVNNDSTSSNARARQPLAGNPRNRYRGASNNFTLSPGGTPTPVPNGTLQLPMVVKVGGKVIYEGQTQAVIDNSQGGAK